jgi:hypothetical protein
MLLGKLLLHKYEIHVSYSYYNYECITWPTNGNHGKVTGLKLIA